MAFLDFGPKYMVGIREIDDQHSRLFDLLNRLHAATSQGEEQSALGVILDELIDYTVFHFQTEEALFKEHGYPNFEEHVHEHNKLTEQAVALQQGFREGSATISFEVLDFLHGWLVDHTTGTDRPAGEYLRSKGLS